MKTLLIIAFVATVGLAKAEKKQNNDTTVCFRVEMDCMSCKLKIEKNIAFEKGVKALDVNFEDKIVKIKYNKLKNSPELLRQAIEKMKYKTELISRVL